MCRNPNELKKIDFIIMILRVKHNLSEDAYDFNILTEIIEEMDTIEYYIESSHKQHPICISISIIKNKQALLETVNYSSSCDLKGSLKNNTGTILMIMGLLKYVFNKHRDVFTISLNDKTMVPKKSILISAKRLLQGRPGWYQEYLGAIPDPSNIQTGQIIEALKQPTVQQRIQKNLPITTQRDWGKTAEIISMFEKITPLKGTSILCTSWWIHRSTIESYPISINVSNKGGSLKNKSINVSKDYFHRRLRNNTIRLFTEYVNYNK